MKRYKIISALNIEDIIVGFELIDIATGIKQSMAKESIEKLLISKAISVEGLELDNNLKLIWKSDSNNIELIENKRLGIFYTKEELQDAISRIDKYKTRKQYNEMIDWLNSEEPKKGMILALYGLRRTGKTVLLIQIAKYFMSKGDKVEYLEIQPGMQDIDLSIQVHNKVQNGCSVLIIDEITLSESLLSNNWLPDRYAVSGIKVIVAGTQSLAIKEASTYSWYDRVKIINTTFISIKEFTRIYNIDNILDYIKFGGVLSNSRLIDNNDSLEYINSSIIDNIKHTLEVNLDRNSMAGLQRELEKIHLIQ